MKYQGLIQRLDKIVQNSGQSNEFDGLKSYLAKCFSPDTPSHDIGIMDLTIEFCNRFRSVKPEDMKEYKVLMEQAQGALESMGYRCDILTSQEHALLASSERCKDWPYKPLGLVKGKMTLAEARKARGLAKISYVRKCFFDIPNWPHKDDIIEGVVISLEPLDDEGNTTRDPQLLDNDLNYISGYKKSDDFPYRRD